MILVTGATGQIGGRVASELAERGVPLRTMSRRPDAIVPASGNQLAEHVVADFDDVASLEAAVDGAGAVLVVSPSNPDMVRQQGNLVRVLAAASPRPYVVKVSGFMTAADSASQSGRWHAAIEAQLLEAGLEALFLRPPFFMQNLLRSASLVAAESRIRSSIGDQRIAMIDAADISRVAAHCLAAARDGGTARPTGARTLTGPDAVGFGEIAGILSDLLGREVRYESVSVEAERSGLLEGGAPIWRADVVAEFQRGFAAGLGAEVTDAVTQLSGAPPRPVARFLEAHQAQFSGSAS